MATPVQRPQLRRHRVRAAIVVIATSLPACGGSSNDAPVGGTQTPSGSQSPAPTDPAAGNAIDGETLALAFATTTFERFSVPQAQASPASAAPGVFHYQINDIGLLSAVSGVAQTSGGETGFNIPKIEVRLARSVTQTQLQLAPLATVVVDGQSTELVGDGLTIIETGSEQPVDGVLAQWSSAGVPETHVLFSTAQDPADANVFRLCWTVTLATLERLACHVFARSNARFNGIYLEQISARQKLVWHSKVGTP